MHWRRLCYCFWLMDARQWLFKDGAPFWTDNFPFNFWESNRPLFLKTKMRNSIENGKCLDAVSLEIVHLVSRTFHTRIPVLLWSRLRMERTCVILCKMARECIQLHAWSIVTMSRESWRNADLQLRYELLWTVHCSFESPCTWN